MDSFTRCSLSSLSERRPRPGEGVRCSSSRAAHVGCRKECTQLCPTWSGPSIAGVTADRIDLVLFDLGGVLIRPGGVAAMRALAGIDSDEALWARWLGCPWVQNFEAGGCTPGEVAGGMVGERWL